MNNATVFNIQTRLLHTIASNVNIDTLKSKIVSVEINLLSNRNVYFLTVEKEGFAPKIYNFDNIHDALLKYNEIEL